MLSVIVPIYNIEKYLPRCIKSIIAQKYKNLEILLIDDGSVDNSLQICDKYAEIDCRIKVFHKKNEGLVKTRKLGLKYATGDYITFVDGDDWIESNMYYEMMPYIENSDIDFIDSGFFQDRCDESKKYENLKNHVYELDSVIRHKFFLTLFSLDNFIEIYPSIWSKIFKADILREAYKQVPDDMEFGEDIINLACCILKSNKLIQIGNAFYHYNYRENSMSHVRDLSYVRKEISLWNYCGDFVLKNDPFMEQKHIDRLLFLKLYNAFNYVANFEFGTIQYYAFPRIDILTNKKIVLYGAGKVGQDYLLQLSKYHKCEIVYWIDKEYEKIHCSYREIVDPEDVLDKDYDFILIAVENQELAIKMKTFLLEKEISEEKIIWYPPKTLY